jgi:nucleoside-diphosphate-sugar epimerase
MQIEVRDARPRRDYLYISDFIRLLLRIRGKTGTYNAGSGASVSVAEVVEIVNQLLGTTKPMVSKLEERRAEVMDVVADVTKARLELSWEPQVSLFEGLQETIASGNRISSPSA